MTFRICPGRYLATDTLLLMIASILHVFDILPNVETSQINPRATTGVVSYVLQSLRVSLCLLPARLLYSHPDSLPCCFKPRSAAALALARNFDYNTVEET